MTRTKLDSELMTRAIEGLISEPATRDACIPLARLTEQMIVALPGNRWATYALMEGELDLLVSLTPEDSTCREDTMKWRDMMTDVIKNGDGYTE